MTSRAPTKTLARIAYEAAAKRERLAQPWADANQTKWAAAADAVAEECARVADRRAERAKKRDTASEDFAAHAALDIAHHIRALKGDAE